MMKAMPTKPTMLATSELTMASPRRAAHPHRLRHPELVSGPIHPRRPSVAAEKWVLKRVQHDGGWDRSWASRAVEQRFELREAGGDGAGVVDLDAGTAGEAGDGHRHRDAVVEVGGDGTAAAQRLAAGAVDDEAVRAFLDPR